MIDHISLRVSNLEKTLPLYKAALGPLGYSVIMEFPGAVGMGADGKPDLWLTQTDRAVNPTHVAFAADREGVRAFHAAGLAAGAADNGAPGLRPEYHPNYYGAFLLDADGNNIETVCHAPEGAAKAPAKKPSKAPAKKPSKAPAKEPSKAPAKKPAAKKPVKAPPKKPAKAPVKPAKAPVKPAKAPVKPAKAPVKPAKAPVKPVKAPAKKPVAKKPAKRGR